MQLVYLSLPFLFPWFCSQTPWPYTCSSGFWRMVHKKPPCFFFSQVFYDVIEFFCSDFSNCIERFISFLAWIAIFAGIILHFCCSFYMALENNSSCFKFVCSTRWCFDFVCCLFYSAVHLLFIRTNQFSPGKTNSVALIFSFGNLFKNFRNVCSQSNIDIHGQILPFDIFLCSLVFWSSKSLLLFLEIKILDLRAILTELSLFTVTRYCRFPDFLDIQYDLNGTFFKLLLTVSELFVFLFGYLRNRLQLDV